MTDKIERIYNFKVRHELFAFGQDLNKIDVCNIIDNLPSIINIGRDTYSVSVKDKEELKKRSLFEFGLEEIKHVHIRGGGLYSGDEEVKLDKGNWAYYIKHRSFILDNVYNDKPYIVESIDYETDQIIKKIPNPKERGLDTYLSKGLVIGYVQSGKTANFTHLISKAASIGYKFIVVLAGMTNTLRSQTQYRIDRELTGNNQYDNNSTFVKWGIHEKQFTPLTDAPKFNYDGDFNAPSENFTRHFSSKKDVSIAVVKKLAREGNQYKKFGSVIGNIINWVESRSDKDMKMPPLMIIDDEADQASIDGSDELNPTTINHSIRYLISLFDQVSYVGYTATPFANIFIDSNSRYKNLPDLYPENFIYSLPEPSGYFGSKEFFGAKGENNKEFLYVNLVDDNERQSVNNNNNVITDSLSFALLDFIFSVIIRRHRGDKNYCGFLVHTDHRTLYHDIVKKKIDSYLHELDSLIGQNNLDCLDFILSRWNIYIKKTLQISKLKGLDYSVPSFDRISLTGSVSEVLSNAKLRVINGVNDTLDYNSEDLDVLICIGGTLMSRGVTIEGLTISYYLRESPRYDTLLQMGRWFGYRSKYEDLVRVYTTRTISEYFEYIVAVEDDLRLEISRYQEENLTPREFSPRVRAHIKMLPSSKMGSALKQKSYAQQTVQTIHILRDMEALKSNQIVVEKLINRSCGDEGRTDQGNYDLSGLPVEDLYGFLKEFMIPSDLSSFDKNDLLRYLDIRIDSGEILDFDLRLSGLINCKSSSVADQYDNGVYLYPVKRNARKSNGWKNIDKGVVNIGVISDSNDMPFEVEKPLLIIYSIDFINSDAFYQYDMNTECVNKSELIEGLDFNPKGFALVFPKSKTQSGETDYYQQIINL